MNPPMGRLRGGTAAAPRLSPEEECSPSRPSVLRCKDHLHVLPTCTPERLCDRRASGSSPVPVHRVPGASSVPSPSSLALAALSLAERKVVAEQEQGIKPLEPLQSLGQEWDGDRISRVGEVSDELLKSRHPSQQLGCDPQFQGHVAEVLHTVQGRVQQEGK